MGLGLARGGAWRLGLRVGLGLGLASGGDRTRGFSEPIICMTSVSTSSMTLVKIMFLPE